MTTKAIYNNSYAANECAPIVLFVYNRPWHTEQTITALQKNELAEKSDLFIYSDAPKNDISSPKVEEVRSIIKCIRGFKSVTVIEREKNWGLADSIVDGVTTVVNKYGRVIVLEDDIVTSPYFLRFMNDGLNIYADKKRVMQIAGYMYPIDAVGLPETFFLGVPDCWGWATWADRWQYFERNPQKLLETFTPEDIHRFNFDGAYDFWSQVKENARGTLYTWAVFWCANVFQMDGIALYPRDSLVHNIGNDQSGEHCGKTEQYDVHLGGKKVSFFEQTLEMNQLAFSRIKKFLKTLQPSLGRRIVSFIKRSFPTRRT